jgi:hypothetical protein
MTAEALLHQMVEDIKNNKEVLSATEAEVLFKVDPEWSKDNLFLNFWNGTYLNLNVYSEVEHHEQQLKMEQGI